MSYSMCCCTTYQKRKTITLSMTRSLQCQIFSQYVHICICPTQLTLCSLAACGHCLVFCCLELIRRKGIFGNTNCRFANLRVRERKTMKQFMQLLSRAFAKIEKCYVGCCQIQKGKKWHKNLKKPKIKWRKSMSNILTESSFSHKTKTLSKMLKDFHIFEKIDKDTVIVVLFLFTDWGRYYVENRIFAVSSPSTDARSGLYCCR